MGKNETVKIDTKTAQEKLKILNDGLDERLKKLVECLDLTKKEICPKELIIYDASANGVVYNRDAIYFYSDLTVENEKLTTRVKASMNLIKKIVDANNTGNNDNRNRETPPLPDIVDTKTNNIPTPTPSEGLTEPTVVVPTIIETPKEEIKTNNGNKIDDSPATSGLDFTMDTNNNTTPKTGKFVISDGDAVIIDENGNVVEVISNGEYNVYDVRYDENGNPIAVRISPDGEEEKWLMINQNGVDVGTFVVDGQQGLYEFNEGTLNIYDKDGNLVGPINSGKYRVYDMKYDENGQLVAVRITPNGEDELWMNVCENNVCVGSFTPNPTYVMETQTLDDGKSKVKLFNTKNLAIGAAIGALVIGSAVAIKSIRKNKEDDNDDFIQDEESLPNEDNNDISFDSGEYDIYDVKKDDDGNVREALVKDRHDSSTNNNGYWLEF